MYDISNFMTWWLNQVVNIIGNMWGLLDNITFAGTSIFKLLIMILIIGALLKVVIVIPSQTSGALINSARERKNSNDNKSK